jgi:hypothetical protein
LETDKKWPKSSNVQIYIYAHHSDLDKSVDFNNVSINEGTTLIANFTVPKTDIDWLPLLYRQKKYHVFGVCSHDFLTLPDQP